MYKYVMACCAGCHGELIDADVYDDQIEDMPLCSTTHGVQVLWCGKCAKLQMNCVKCNYLPMIVKYVCGINKENTLCRQNGVVTIIKDDDDDETDTDTDTDMSEFNIEDLNMHQLGYNNDDVELLKTHQITITGPDGGWYYCFVCKACMHEQVCTDK